MLHPSGLRVGLGGIAITCFHRYVHGLEKLRPGRVNRSWVRWVVGPKQGYSSNLSCLHNYGFGFVMAAPSYRQEAFQIII